ncbi:MAG: (Fe-S)-binding protein [Chloroflexi bacterium]|nr:(Fe-S)-binding protein [Chloroflexota bacterium]
MNCPTFVATGLEPESPRGRVYLIRAAAEGRVELNDAVLPHLELCLQCRNCESVCPSGVPFGRIMEGARAQIFQQRKGAMLPRVVRTAILRGLLPHRGRIRVLAAALRLYQRGGLQRAVRSRPIGRVLPRRLREMEALMPRVAVRPFEPSPVPARPAGEVEERVAFFSGCVMPFMYSGTQDATVRVLTRNGREVVTPPEQTCCGALMVHSGDREAARVLARKNIDLFLSLGVGAVVVNAAGCGSTLKEYHELLEHDADYADKAARFSGLVRDVTEYVARLPFTEGLGAVHARVTYQDSCHLAHAQRIKHAPRHLIQAIPGVEFVDMPNADRCCGSAGIYNVVQREMSMQVLDFKMQEVAEAEPDIILTANPGCMAQLETGLRRHGLQARVMHVVDLLDLAYRRGAASDASGQSRR